ncbi:seipin-1 [Nicotiana tomentosiformis]|uniref:seipin-1 n=1 Tax=Nicotiana tomentosiformis TaxID=4098 RepID=UPI00051BA70B|nr:seipin-1 [Nicotiana tomentosiformis]
MEEKDELEEKAQEEEEEYVDDNNDYEIKNNLPVQNSSSISWFTKMISLQVEIFTTILVSLVSPIFYILSFVSDFNFLRPEETEKNVAVAVNAAATVPSKVVHGSTLLLKKFGVGILGAAYVGMVLTTLLILSGVLGFGLVRMWAEEPVVLREQLYFDYADIHPKAVFSFAEYGVENYNHNFMMMKQKKNFGVPVGHTMYVSLFLLMPESDFNRDIGVFQLVSEALSAEGIIMARSSHPCMLRFRSLPIRLMREFIMSVPLVLGLTAETQRMIIPMLKHKEGTPRTEAIRITMIPRAGTLALPQLYQSEIILKSHPPWYKDLAYKWKWTFSVWTSMYMFITLLIILLNWCRPLVFPVIATSFRTHVDENLIVEASEEPQEKAREESDVSESVRRLRQSRRKRKAMLQQSVSPELADDSASSISVTREDTAESSE